MSTPNRKNAEELVKDLLWQNFQLTQLNSQLLDDKGKLVAEIQKLKTPAPAKTERPSIVR